MPKKQTLAISKPLHWLPSHHQPQKNQGENNEEYGCILRDEDTRTICFIGEIDWKQLANFHGALMDFQKKSGPITLFICSFGGAASHAKAIYDLIRTSPNPITTIGYGYLNSAGVIIYLAGHRRLLLPQARLTFHWGVLGPRDDSFDEDDLKREQEQIPKINKAVQTIIKENSSLSSQQIKKFMHDSKSLSAKEAVHCGLAHEIVHTFPKRLPKPKKQ